MADFGNFSLRQVKIVIAGIVIKKGLVSLEVTPVGEAFGDKVSGDGRVTRWRTGEVRHDATLILHGSSPENSKLSEIHKADLAADNGAGVFIMSVEDLNGTSFATTDAAWIRQLGNKAYATEIGDTTWPIRMVLSEPTSFSVGGN